MSSVARISMIVSLVTAGLICLGCERAERPPDSNASNVAPPDPIPDSSSAVGRMGWPAQGGPFLAIPDDSMASAMIVAGIDDSTTAGSSGINDTLTIDLFSTAGKVGTAILAPSRPGQNRDQCLAWPSARVRRTLPSRLIPRWSVGLLTGRVTPLPMDSLAGLSKSDSAQLVSEIARLASIAPDDTSLIFRGLPFRVQTTYLIHVSDSETVLVATVIRSINQEASARAEHLLLVAGRTGADRRSPYVLHHSERNSGPEETVETADVLGAMLVGAEHRPTIVLGRSDDSGMAFSLLERDDRGGWTLRWSSAFSDC